MNSKLHYDRRLKLRSFRTCAQMSEIARWCFVSNWLRQKWSNWPMNNKQSLIVFFIYPLLLKYQSLFRWSHVAFLQLIWNRPANSHLLSRSTVSSRLLLFQWMFDAPEFLPFRMKTEIRSTAVEEEELLCAWLKTDYQTCDRKINPSRIEFANYALQSYPRMVDQAWKSEHRAKMVFSLLLYNISSLRNAFRRSYRLHFYLLSGHLGTHWTSLQRWRQLSTCFSLQVSIHHLLSNKVSNSFGGVCLAIAREFPHRSVSQFQDINNLIAGRCIPTRIKKIYSSCLSIHHSRKKCRLWFSMDCIGTIEIWY